MQMSATLKTGQFGQHEEVDDVAAQRAGLPEEPVGQVAGDAGQEQAEGDRPATAADPAAEVEHDQHRGDRHAA